MMLLMELRSAGSKMSASPRAHSWARSEADMLAHVRERKIRRCEADATSQTYRQRGTEALAFIYVPHV